ncbi:MAG: hypothetical protein NC311_11865 [Muribaculaceae bacterium]|nr:hypothetical protein [Muribaculaceae bacterium]
MSDCNHCSGCKHCEDIHVEAFRAITKSFEGKENGTTKTVVDNDAKTIEVKLKSQQYASKYAFPNKGDEGVVYIDIVENEAYRWDKKTKTYVRIGADYHQIKIINGGSANG